MTISSRPFAGPPDIRAMIDLIRIARPPECFGDFPGAVDLHEVLALPAEQAGVRLWQDAAGPLAAFVFAWAEYGNLYLELAPGAPAALEDEAVAWGIDYLERAAREGAPISSIDTTCRDDDLRRRTILDRHGFQPRSECALRMAYPLSGPIPEPRLPPGFKIRPLAGESEVARQVALHRAAFGTEHMTVEHRLSMMRQPDYEPELDLVVESPEGELAASCVCHIPREVNAQTGRQAGWTDPIVTHPHYQRRGLAPALIVTGFRLLRERGMQAALLTTSSENTAGRRAFESAGYRVEASWRWYSRPLAAQAEA